MAGIITQRAHASGQPAKQPQPLASSAPNSGVRLCDSDRPVTPGAEPVGSIYALTNDQHGNNGFMFWCHRIGDLENAAFIELVKKILHENPRLDDATADATRA